MARRVSTKRETPNEKLARLFEAGEVIQMRHAGKGVRYITNTEGAIRAALARGYEHVEYAEKTVKEVLPKDAAPPAKPKRSPGRPKKAETKDGE